MKSSPEPSALRIQSDIKVRKVSTNYASKPISSPPSKSSKADSILHNTDSRSPKEDKHSESTSSKLSKHPNEIVFRPSCKEDFTESLSNMNDLNLIKPVKIIIEEDDIDESKTVGAKFSKQ